MVLQQTLQGEILKINCSRLRYGYLKFQVRSSLKKKGCLGTVVIEYMRIHFMYSRCPCLKLLRLGRSNVRRGGTAPCRSCPSMPTPFRDPTETHKSQEDPLSVTVIITLQGGKVYCSRHNKYMPFIDET